MMCNQINFEITDGLYKFGTQNFEGQIAQSVEQRTENPCVGGSIPSLPTFLKRRLPSRLFYF